MTRPRLRPVRLLLAGLALFGVAGLAAPYFRLDQYGEAVRSAIEASLGRRVQIGAVRLHLFRGPGVTIQEVVIAEDPAFGIEPFAWVESLEASPAWWSLWAGRLRFSSLRWNQPVVNLVKEQGQWNFEKLLAGDGVAGLPRIEVRQGRVNFKTGETKSVFYLTNTDLDLQLEDASPRRWRFTFTSEPARTDRVMVGGAGRGMGLFTGRGRRDDRELTAEIQLDKSPLGDLIALIQGRDLGMHGVVSSRARVKGPPHALEFTGRLEIEQLHRWDRMPLWDRTFPIVYRGRLDLDQQRLELESESQAKGAPPLALRYQVANYLSAPVWNASFQFSQMPVASVLPLARHVGLAVPEDFDAAGTLDGDLAYAGDRGLEGRVTLQDGILRLPRRPVLRAARVDLTLAPEGGRLTAQEVAAEPRSGPPGTVRVDAAFGWRSDDLSLQLAANGLPLDALPLETVALTLPFPAAGGRWSGALRYRRASGAVRDWEGAADLEAATATVEGLAQPVVLESARLRMQGPRMSVERMEGTLGKLAFRGQYTFDPAAPTPNQFRLEFEELDLAELEDVFLPSLRRGSFFRRALGRTVLPRWLASRRTEARVRAAEVRLAEWTLSNAAATVVWHGPRLEFRDVEGRAYEGAVTAEADADLAGAMPRYRLRLAWENVRWSGIESSGDGLLETAGLGSALFANLRAEGSFVARALDPDALLGLERAAGCYQTERQARGLLVRFPAVQAMADGEPFQGTGVTLADGTLSLQLANRGRRMQLTGSLARAVARAADADETKP
jgi:hypothetical protein